jgi:hypothetical protein
MGNQGEQATTEEVDDDNNLLWPGFDSDSGGKSIVIVTTSFSTS